MSLLVDMVDFFRKLNYVCDCSYIEHADANRGVAVSFIGGAAVSAAPTKLLVYILVGALETSAPPWDTLLWMFAAIYLTAMHSTSTRAFFGRVFTATAERAGNG